MLPPFRRKVAPLVVCRAWLRQVCRWSVGVTDFFNHNKNMILNCYLYGVLRSMVSRSVRCYNDAVPPVSAAHNDVRLGRRTYNITRETQIS